MHSTRPVFLNDAKGEIAAVIVLDQESIMVRPAKLATVCVFQELLPNIIYCIAAQVNAYLLVYNASLAAGWSVSSHTCMMVALSPSVILKSGCRRTMSSGTQLFIMAAVQGIRCFSCRKYRLQRWLDKRGVRGSASPSALSVISILLPWIQGILC